MNNLKKLALGLLVSAMAIGFSAFKTSEKAKFAQEVFYNISGAPNNIASNYVYRPDGACALNTLKKCSATWNYTGTLSEGDNPNGSKVSTTDSPGAWDGN